MSNIKQTFVCVEEGELARLKYNEAKLHSANQAPREKIEAIRTDIEQQLKEKLEKMDRRQLEFQQYVYDLNGTMRYLEIENQRRFSQQNQKLDHLRQEYFSLLRMERDEYLSIFAVQEQKFRSLLDEEKKAMRQAGLNLGNKMDSMPEIKKQERVKNFTIELAILIGQTINIPHQQFANGRFEQIKNQLQTASEDINNGFFETALSTARNVYWQLVELRANVLQLEHEFITLYSALSEVLSYLSEKAIINRKRKLELSGYDPYPGVNYAGNKDIEIDIDYWSNGELSKYENEINYYREQLVKNEKNLSIEQLKEFIRLVEKVELKFPEIMTKARENILASQLRANLAEKIVFVLKEQLFAVADSFYEDNDQRKAYKVKLKNRAGNEILIIISPVEKEFGKNNLTINFYETKIINQKILDDRTAEILSALNSQGLKVGTLQTISDLPGNDFSALSKNTKSSFSGTANKGEL